jgi:lipopolysaccharide export system protein LptA
MPRRADAGYALVALVAAVALAIAGAPAGAAEAKREGGGSLFEEGFSNKKEPITVTSDTLEYDYKANVVVYRGGVQATQSNVTLKSDTLTVTLQRAEGAGAGDGVPGGGGSKLREIVAVGNVRIDNGTRYATGGRAVFDQGRRTLILTETPVLHDGQNEVAGDRVVVYLDEDRSVVEGGRKRVKAVLYPGKEGGLAPSPGTPKPAADAGAKPTVEGEATQRSDAGGQSDRASP